MAKKRISNELAPERIAQLTNELLDLRHRERDLTEELKDEVKERKDEIKLIQSAALKIERTLEGEEQQTSIPGTEGGYQVRGRGGVRRFPLKVNDE